MRVISYYPKDLDEIAALQKNVAKVHSEAVTAYISKLSCPKEQKLKLIDAIKNNIKEQAINIECS